MKNSRMLLGLILALYLVGIQSSLVMADTQPKTLRGSTAKTAKAKPSANYHAQSETWGQKHPKMKSAAIGGGIGAAAGAATGLISGKGMVRGAAIGAGTGAGVGLIRSSSTLKKHPLGKDAATGATVGLGLGWAASRGRHEGRDVGVATGLGAAAGLCIGYLKKKGVF